MEKPSYKYELEFSVRDYECDLQGIVNNSVYQNYLEHTRHEFLKHKGIDFAQLHKEGIDAVVIRVEMDYLFSLTSGDRFVVRLNVERESKLRLVFKQDIYRLSDEKPILRAKVFAVCLKNGRPFVAEKLIEVLELEL